MFSEKGELHFWKYNGEFFWRLRVDGEGDDCEVYEDDHILWGTKVSNNYCLIEEHKHQHSQCQYRIPRTQN